MMTRCLLRTVDMLAVVASSASGHLQLAPLARDLLVADRPPRWHRPCRTHAPFPCNHEGKPQPHLAQRHPCASHCQPITPCIPFCRLCEQESSIRTLQLLECLSTLKLRRTFSFILFSLRLSIYQISFKSHRLSKTSST